MAKYKEKTMTEALDTSTDDSDSMKMWKALLNAFDFLNEELFDNQIGSKHDYQGNRIDARTE